MTVLRTDLGRKPVTVWGQRSQRAPKGLPRAPPSRAQRAVLSGAASLPALIAAVSLRMEMTTDRTLTSSSRSGLPGRSVLLPGGTFRFALRFTQTQEVKGQ